MHRIDEVNPTPTMVDHVAIGSCWQKRGLDAFKASTLSLGGNQRVLNRGFKQVRLATYPMKPRAS